MHKFLGTIRYLLESLMKLLDCRSELGHEEIFCHRNAVSFVVECGGLKHVGVNHVPLYSIGLNLFFPSSNTMLRRKHNFYFTTLNNLPDVWKMGQEWSGLEKSLQRCADVYISVDFWYRSSLFEPQALFYARRNFLGRLIHEFHSPVDARPHRGQERDCIQLHTVYTL